MKESTTFTSTRTGRTYKMRHTLDCRSSWIIYLLTCKFKGCGRQYVGRSWREFYKRHYGHRQQFKNQLQELGKHFHHSNHGPHNVQIQIIDQVREGNKPALKQCEGFWQHQLMTFVEQGGLNSLDDLDDENK